MFVAAGLAGASFSVIEHFDSWGARALTLSLSFLSLLGGAYCFFYVSKSVVLLFADRISIEDVTGTKEFYRRELRGWRLLRTSPVCLLLQPSDKGIRSVKIGLTFPIDEQFEEWLEPLPCLDAEETAASEKEIADDQRLSESPSDRALALARGKRRGRYLTGISIVICIWAILYPAPYLPLMVALLFLPWIGLEIVRRSGGLFRIDERLNDAHPSVATAVIFPPMALLLRSVLDYNVLQSTRAVVLYAAVGGALVLIAMRFDPTLRLKKFSVVAFCLIGLAYGFGAVIEINILLDRSAGTRYSAIVQGKHVSHGKRTTYHLKLEPWGPETKPNDLEVHRATYDPIACGDVAVLTVRKGALGVNWYYLSAWQRGEETRPCG